MADSEADIYEVLEAGMDGPSNSDGIVRACYDRAQPPAPKGMQTKGVHLREHVLNTPILFTQTISVRGRRAKVGCEERGRRQPRESRPAEVEVRAAQFTLRPPWQLNTSTGCCRVWPFLPDRGLADLVRLPLGPRLPGHEL
jgi:hypothetical protein